MKKILISLVSLIGAVSLLISILVFPNLKIIEKPNSIVKTLDIVQQVGETLPDDVESMVQADIELFLTDKTFEIFGMYPDNENLYEKYNITVPLGESLEFENFILPLSVKINQDFFQENTMISLESLKNVFLGAFDFTITNTEGKLYYTDITFKYYFSTFSSSNLLKIFTFVVESLEEIRDSDTGLPVFIPPEYEQPQNDNAFIAIKNGFNFIGDIFDFILAQIKSIYAYVEIPLNLYLV